jgi:hypothetical protein
MFSEFANQTWTPSSASVVITNNTDMSIDGSSKKIVWTSAQGQYVDIGFDEVDLSSYEEISFHIFFQDLFADEIFSITIETDTYIFKKSEFRRRMWNHILIDCSSYTGVSNIRVASMVSNLVLFVDYVGYRKATYNCDIDIIQALKSHITLNYGVTTSLIADASAGDTTIALESENYITDTSVLEIDNGSGTIETVYLLNKSGELVNPLNNNFSEYDEVRVICPVLGEDFEDLEPDPVCGIKVYDVDTEKRKDIIKLKDSSKTVEYLGNLGIIIYIDTQHKKKLLQMSREFNKKYGSEFQFLLDGEQVEIYLDSDTFTEDVIGNNPRKAYFYRIEPQPYLYAKDPQITTINLTTEVRAVE